MKRLQWVAVIATCAMALPAAYLTWADEDDAREAARLSKAGEILPLEKILERARAEHPGKVLETELDHEHGKYMYEVEILDDSGVVWKMKLDAKSGALIKSRRDDD